MEALLRQCFLKLSYEARRMRAFSYALWLQFRSRDKDGGHTIRCAIVQNPMLHTNLVTVSVIESDLWGIEVLQKLR